MSEETTAAVGAPRALPRSAALVDLHDRSATVRETTDTTRVYRREWLMVFAGDTQEAAEAHFVARFQGRVRDDEWQVLPVSEISPPVVDHYRLLLKLPNLKAEFKTPELAAEFIAARPDPGSYETVVRNSRDEHAIRDYGVKKLAAS